MTRNGGSGDGINPSGTLAVVNSASVWIWLLLNLMLIIAAFDLTF
jgi:hypothetical protein